MTVEQVIELLEEQPPGSEAVLYIQGWERPVSITSVWRDGENDEAIIEGYRFAVRAAKVTP